SPRLGERLGSLERGESAPDEQLVPATAVLIEQQDWFAGGTDPRAQSRCLDLHQRDEAVHLCFVRHQLRENAAEAERVLAEPRPYPIVARGRGVALIEDEIDDREHGREPRRELRPARNLEWNLRVREGAFGS